MRTSKGNSYCSDIAQLNQYLEEIKITSCPHCGATGYLIGHGFLRGYSENAPTQVIRGRRFFCSNRYRKKGCGGTFSVLLGEVLKRFVVRANTLWIFLQGIADGFNKSSAWQKAQSGFSVQSGYRLWQRFHQAQSYVRTLLCRRGPPPFVDSEQPIAQLMQHFKSVFDSNTCPFESFQVAFQQPLLQ